MNMNIDNLTMREVSSVVTRVIPIRLLPGLYIERVNSVVLRG